MFIFRDDLFYWVCGVVANSLEEAAEFAEKAGHYNILGCRYTIEEIKLGLIVEGGGNG